VALAEARVAAMRRTLTSATVEHLNYSDRLTSTSERIADLETTLESLRRRAEAEDISDMKQKYLMAKYEALSTELSSLLGEEKDLNMALKHSNARVAAVRAENAHWEHKLAQLQEGNRGPRHRDAVPSDFDWRKA
jgi:chromosome segregation ATPase